MDKEKVAVIGAGQGLTAMKELPEVELVQIEPPDTQAIEEVVRQKDQYDRRKRAMYVPQKFKKWKRGSNYTPPKKKRTKNKKTHR